MKNCKYVWALLLIALISGPASAQTVTGNFNFEGMNRDYRIFIPSSYSSGDPTPLVINMHGYTSNATQQEFYSGMNAVADTAGFLVCYPNGINNAWNVGFTGNYNAGINDVGFINLLIDVLGANYNIDLSRVYACGMSNGGFMSYRLSCELSHRIAAMASVTGAMTDSIAFYCNAQRPVPVLEIHGTDDGTVPYNGSPGIFSSIDATLAFWVQENSCTGSPVLDTLPNINTNDNSTVTSQYWGACGNNAEVLHFKIENGGHTWPGSFSVPGLGATNQDINASREIWEFFLNHSHPNPATGISVDAPDLDVQIGPSPANEFVRVQAPNGMVVNGTIINSSGQILKNFHLETGGNVSVSGFPNGIYFVKMQVGDSFLTKKMVIAR